ncbi:Ethanolamine kinase 2 [Sphaceloma murrayae]|uniref:ethanolamine kinase n=1 Tax=Sphaceloma murrayae TaxID=2082308 RepID=A0A2K1QXN3_9PEZI|nr:Ethanolamine kinase 2 [Sphaceloma murrayae]
MSPVPRTDSPLSVRFLDLTYDPLNSEKSALTLLYTLLPEWRHSEGKIELVRFTDGITNTLLKAEKRRPGSTQEEVDEEAVLLRAYGEGTDVLIDREREIRAHSLLASKGLAPPLFARFNNGLLYKFIAGDVCSAQDLRKRDVYCAVAEKLGQWHGSLPIAAISDINDIQSPGVNGHVNGGEAKSTVPFPNLWSVLQSWIDALPAQSDTQRQRIKTLQTEFDLLKSRLIRTRGLYGKDYIFSHCDLLCGNVIVDRSHATNGHTSGSSLPKIDFIDYEYATPAPAAFDIANHFAEWGGLDCDYTAMPTTSQRREFIQHYVHTYRQHASPDSPDSSMPKAVDHLLDQVDLYRGVPGFYWGVWALIQAQISQIDFDYPSYAEVRLGEYYAWKAETDGSRAKAGKDMPLREKMWASD